MRRRVLHVVEVDAGGVASFVREVAKEQSRRGDEVHVLAPSSFPFPQEAHACVWAVDRRTPFSLVLARSRIPAAVRAILPDVIHLHSFVPGLLGRLSGLGRSMVVFQPHAWAFNATNSGSLSRVIAAWERVAARRANLIAAVSQDEVEEGRSRGVGAEYAITGVPVDTDRFHPVDRPTQVDLRHQLGVQRSRLVVCVGRLCRQKGQDLLVEAWRAAPPQDAELVMVGSGDGRALLGSDGLPGSVRAVGHSDDVRPWLWAADLVVQPSRYEGMSIALGEALASGRSVVSTRVNGALEAIGTDEGETAGAVVDQGDMGGFIDACKRRLRDGELLSRESEIARRRALELYSPSTVVDRIESLYDLGIRQHSITRSAS